MELSAFTNLFQNLQNYVVGILNEDEILQQMGCVFLSENALDIEYQIRDALNKQGMACVVMTPKATYQGHNGIQQTFTCDELTIQIVENPIINRARLKKAGLQHGTCLDVAKQASDRLAGPQGGYFGQFTTKRIQEAEQGGLLVCTATFGCTVYERLDAVISGDLSGKWVEVPFVRTSELSDYIDNYLSTHMPPVEGFLPLSGGEMSGDILFQPNYNIYWGTPDGYDGRINASTPGLTIYNDAEDQWRFKASFMSESEYDVLRRRDLSSVEVPTKLSELSNDVGFVVSADVVMRTNASPLTITVPYDYGLTIQTPNGTPLLETIDLNRTAINSLSTGTAEIASDGYLVSYRGAGVDTTKLSAWNWITTGSTSIGDLLSSEHSAILGEVSEDYVAYNWLIQQGYATSAQMNEALSNYLPLSGGYMQGGITWDYGGMGGPQIYGPYSPQQLAFTTTYQPDAEKMVFLDIGRIQDESGQATIAYLEDLSGIQVPTKLSELSNDVGYTTDEDVYGIMQPVQDSITTLSNDMKGYIPLSVDSPVAAQITGGNTAGWEFDDQNGSPIFKIDEYGAFFSKRADIYGELYYKNQALSDYIDGKLPSVPDKLSQLSNDVGYITDAALSDYLPLSGGTMNNSASITFLDQQDNESLVFDGENGMIQSRGGGLQGFSGFMYNGQLKYSVPDTESSFTPQTPTQNSTSIMRGGDMFAVLGDLSALIHAT